MLAERLNRLRVQHPSGVAPPDRSEPVQAVSRTHCGDVRRLADALGGRMAGDGLVVRESLVDVGAAPVDMARLSRLPEVCTAPVDDWVYIDTETTGLAGGTGTVAFIVGVARYRKDARLQVRQYILGGFIGEGPMLQALVDWVGGSATLVSYNGRCFDLPLLAGRLRLHRRPDCLSELGHLDLMYSVRRAFRHHWPDCRLQTVERRRLGIERVDDLPGAQAPLAWQRWLGDADPSMLAGVLAHNHQDLVSLARLHNVLIDDYADAERGDLDPGGIARAWQAAGKSSHGLTLLERHAARLDEGSLLRLAADYRRAGRWQDAEAIWLRLYSQGSHAAALALSKYHEHHRRDFDHAMYFAVACGSTADDPRRRRLRRKLGRPSADAAAAKNVNLELPLWPQPGVGAASS